MMVINNNLPALNAYDVVNNTSNQLQKSIQKLSTGLRINSAADDAAGLSISEKMRAQINGLDQAVRNTQDGISLIQTAEGALTETHSILQRMRELSVQAANDTYTAQDRSYIQEEVDLLRDEIDHIGNTTTFNTKKLLNGDSAALWSSDKLTTKALIRGGLRTIDAYGQKSSAEGNYKIDITSTAGTGEVQKTTQFRIKHAVAEMEWDEDTATTDGSIIAANGASATGMSRLMNTGDTFSVDMGTKLTAATASTATAVNSEDPALTITETANKNQVNGLVRLSVAEDGTVTGTIWGNAKDGTALKGVDFDASTTASALAGTTGVDATVTSGVSTFNLGNLKTGSALTEGDHYYQITAAGDGVDPTSGTAQTPANTDINVSATVTLGGTAYKTNYVMSQSALSGTSDLEIVANAVTWDAANEEYTGMNAVGTEPAFGVATLTKNGYDITSVTFPDTTTDTDTTAGVTAAAQSGYTTSTAGNTLTVTANAGSTTAGSATALTTGYDDPATNLLANNGLSATNTVATGRLTFDVDSTTLQNAKFSGLDKNGNVYSDADVIITINTTESTGSATIAGGNNVELSVKDSSGTKHVIAELTLATNISGADGEKYAIDTVAGITTNDTVFSITNGGTTHTVTRTNTSIAADAGNGSLTLNSYDTSNDKVRSESVTLTLDTSATAAGLQTGSAIATFTSGQGLPDNAVNLAKLTAKQGEAKDSTIGQVANYDTKLRDLEQFWDSQGNFLLEDPQTITITQGDGKTAKVTLYKYDTVSDMTSKINNAIAKDLGQDKYTDATGAKKFATFVSNESKDDVTNDDMTADTSEAVEGTMLIRSIVPGTTGTLSFASNNEDLINALALNTIQAADDSTYTVTITDAHDPNNVIVNQEKITGNVLVGKLNPNVDVEFDAMTGVTAKWNDADKKFELSGAQETTYLHLADNTTVFQIGANSGDDMGINIGDMRSHALGLDGVLVTDHKSASRSISIIDSAIDKVSTQRAKLGAYQNRLEHTAANLTTSAENLTAAESRIRDTDMAREMMNFTKLQIMLQAGNSMLAQANQLPQNVLSLIR